MVSISDARGLFLQAAGRRRTDRKRLADIIAEASDGKLSLDGLKSLTDADVPLVRRRQHGSPDRGLLKQVILFTDGSCLGNPGAGGWACLLRWGSVEKELYGAEPNTTNNRMELQAVIAGLAALKEQCAVKVVTDSQYVQRAMTKHLARGSLPVGATRVAFQWPIGIYGKRWCTRADVTT